MNPQTMWNVLEHLALWQRRNANRSKRCLEAVRAALATENLRLPVSNVDYPGMMAIDNGARLAQTPAKWGWKLLGTSAKSIPKDEISLVYFKGCGFIVRAGRFAGHIALFKPSTNMTVSNENHPLSLWWKLRVAYVFTPLT